MRKVVSLSSHTSQQSGIHHHGSATSAESKDERHDALKEIISRNELSNQSEVVEFMETAGFEVTQSSISRDFHELGITKVAGVYRILTSPLGSFQSAIKMLVIDMDSAGENVFVIKTTPGGASAVAEAVDIEHIDGVVGTVAGDNTIFVATKNKAAQTRVREMIKKL